MKVRSLGLMSILAAVSATGAVPERLPENVPVEPLDKMVREVRRRPRYLARAHPRDCSGQDLTEAEQEAHRAFMRQHEAASTRRLSRRERKARR